MAGCAARSPVTHRPVRVAVPPLAPSTDRPQQTGDAGMRINSWFVAVAFLAVPAAAFAQQDSHKPAPTSAAVDFGVLPTAPLGPLPCLQSGAIGGAADPCSYKLHHLTPEEVTIKQGGEVTFQIHGGGHGFAIYEVSKDT